MIGGRFSVPNSVIDIGLTGMAVAGEATGTVLGRDNRYFNAWKGNRKSTPDFHSVARRKTYVQPNIVPFFSGSSDFHLSLCG